MIACGGLAAITLLLGVLWGVLRAFLHYNVYLKVYITETSVLLLDFFVLFFDTLEVDNKMAISPT